MFLLLFLRFSYDFYTPLVTMTWRSLFVLSLVLSTDPWTNLGASPLNLSSKGFHTFWNIEQTSFRNCQVLCVLLIFTTGVVFTVVIYTFLHLHFYYFILLNAKNIWSFYWFSYAVMLKKLYIQYIIYDIWYKNIWYIIYDVSYII